MPNYYTEETFKDSKWTMFFEMAAGKSLTPYNYICIQAPRGVAEDVLQAAFGVDPHGTNRFGNDYAVTEDMETPNWIMEFASNNSCFIIRHDAIPYYAAGIWKVPRWTKEKEYD